MDEDQKEIQNNVINENNKCEKKDTSSEDDENDDEKLSLIDKAFYEKELVSFD